MKNQQEAGESRPSRAILPLALLMVCHLVCQQQARATLRLVPEVYPNIQDAVNHAVQGDTILLSSGVYSGSGNYNIDPGTKNLVFTSREGADHTIIDCGGLGRGFSFQRLGINRSTHVEKLTIRNGYAAYPSIWGGAIFCNVTSVTISDCRFLNNHATRGGALSLGLSSTLVERCVFGGNRADGSGGAIDVDFGQGAVIGNCVITGNSAQSDGGGVNFHDPGTFTIWGCTVSGNSAGGGGGGIATVDRTTVTRCILWGNCASNIGRELGADNADDVSFICCDVDTTGVEAYSGSFNYDQCVFTDPAFCAPVPCSQTTDGDWTLDGESPCLPENSPCGQLIGALGQGCGSAPATGACCLPDRRCVISSRLQCEGQSGTYMGNGIACLPNPCLPTSGVPVTGEASTWGRIKARFRSGE